MTERIDSASRLIAATPGTLYLAFAEPGAMEQWIPPNNMTGRMLHFDFREGGSYRMRLTYADPQPERGKTSEDSDEVEARLTRLEDARRIEQEITFGSEDPAFSGIMRMTWTFEPAEARTLVTVRAENVPEAIRPEDHEAGLNSSLDNLAGFVEDDPVGLVLIHGAGLGAFIWDDVVSRMSQPALPVELPNRGGGDRANRDLTLHDYTTAVAEQVQRWDRRRVVLVAHSIGGCVALEVAERLGDRVVGVVGIGAAFPRSGESFISCLPFPQKLIMPLVLRVFGTKPPARAIEQSLCADLSPEPSRRVVERFTPESRSLYTGKVQYRSLPPERCYVKLTDDRAFPPSVQDAMIENLDATRVVELDSGHLPMISRPGEVADVFDELAEGTGSSIRGTRTYVRF